MSQYPARRDLVTLCLVTTLLLCGCSSSRLATEGGPMPETQVATFIQTLTPSSAYDTPPRFLNGYAPFFPETEAKSRQWGYAVVEFNVAADGATGDIRGVLATARSE